MLDVLTQDPITHRGSRLRGASVEVIDGLLNGGNLGHAAPFLQTCLQYRRKQVGAQALQNVLLMKSIGDQVRDYRVGKGLTTAQLAKAAGTKRQNIEQLEAAGNRLPKYFGTLAAAMGTTADAMLATAGLKPGASPVPVAAEPTVGYSLEPISVGQAVHRLAEALMLMDPIGRHLAESAFVTLARQPEQPGTALEVLEVAIKNHSQPPAPPPPAQPSRKKKETAAQERAPGKVKLELKIGGGDKRQLALPLRTVRDPFDYRAASPSERAWYERLKVAPKARLG